ncbi:MAG TPA: tetratricopeptide repeat protein [Thermoanaerobaculia bacterium]|nr:tetratricopeptide repeat protein [Thermoanaerobaculia bacterium]
MTVKVLPLLFALGAAALPDLGWRPQLPAGVQRWLYNSRERTERAVAAHAAGEGADALRYAETALRLAPEDPRAQYNAGAAALAAKRDRRAAEVLEQAAKGAPRELAPAAHYNLGNAKLASGDPAAAVEAYKQALRLTPGDQDAKHNLEIALREREKQRRQRMGLPRQGARGDRRGDQQTREQGRRQDNPREQPPQPSPAGPGGEQRPRQRPQGSPLPKFDEQPDMSAGEAAALLESVENLERQQRRDTAAKQSRRKALRGKDW